MKHVTGTQKILTVRMIRDYLWLRGPMSKEVLASFLNMPENIVMATLLRARKDGDVEYSADAGKWYSRTFGSC